MERLEPLRLPEDSPVVARDMKAVAQEALMYFIVSGCAFVVDIAILYALARLEFRGAPNALTGIPS